jgi:hypothetical protein
VFVVSTVFCKVQRSQCFSWAKAASLIVVVIAVLMYSHASSFVKAHSNGDHGIHRTTIKDSLDESELGSLTSDENELDAVINRHSALDTSADLLAREDSLLANDMSPTVSPRENPFKHTHSETGLKEAV